MDAIGMRVPRVAEVQGCDGPFGFSELLLQKIWLRGSFAASNVRTADGRTLHIYSPGKWNRMAGPDFLGARLLLEGRQVEGDVELHLHASDWDAHRHALDPAYDRVVLHVVLFAPEEGYATRNRDGRLIPMLVLLPLLPYDLEAFAWDDAAELLAGEGGRDILRWLAAMPESELRSQVRWRANCRWNDKVRLATARVQRLGWERACHATALEILGYRQNRLPMLSVAERWPLAAWRNDGGGLAAAIARRSDLPWRRQGVRPLNQPKRRLEQYGAWVTHVPDWPERLKAIAFAMAATSGEGGSDNVPTRDFRLRRNVAQACEQWRERLTAGAIGGSRWDSLVCDGFLPLLGACGFEAAEEWWWHWMPGEAPEGVLRLLAPLGLTKGLHHPASHGLVQGLLHWWFELERPEWYLDLPGVEDSSNEEPSTIG